jgi:hypothetical protein
MASSLALLPSESHSRVRASRLPSQSRDRWRFLAEASVMFSEADDVEEILAALLRVVVPQFADVCIVLMEPAAGIDRTRGALARTSDEILRAIARDDVSVDRLGEFPPSTVIRVPIRPRGQPLGVVYFVATPAGRRRYRPNDTALAHDLVHRFGTAIHRAQQHDLLRRALISRADHQPITDRTDTD